MIEEEPYDSELDDKEDWVPDECSSKGDDQNSENAPKNLGEDSEGNLSNKKIEMADIVRMEEGDSESLFSEGQDD